ncbi:MAG: hypothetical protein KAH00_01760 [Cocleimonas sp.]|nr:hypothetical protein [Cocleimonas sp.]
MDFAEIRSKVLGGTSSTSCVFDLIYLKYRPAKLLAQQSKVARMEFTEYGRMMHYRNIHIKWH